MLFLVFVTHETWTGSMSTASLDSLVFVEFSYSLIYVCRMWCLNVELAPRHGTTELKPPIRAELGDRGGGADLDGGG